MLSSLSLPFLLLCHFISSLLLYCGFLFALESPSLVMHLIALSLTLLSSSFIALTVRPPASATPHPAPSTPELLANVSHELRTPMHAILSYAELGEQKFSSATPEKVLSYFQRISSSGKRLLKLIDQLLEVSRLESGKTPKKRHTTDLSKTLKKAQDEVSELLNSKSMAFETQLPQEPVMASFDDDQIHQVLINLFSNAIKFSPQNSTIAISIEKDLEKLEWVMSCTDQGVGVPEGELEWIFERFAQSSRTKTGAGGTGLGLSISRKIIELHQGKIWAQNLPQQGAKFSFSLPMT